MEKNKNNRANITRNYPSSIKGYYDLSTGDSCVIFLSVINCIYEHLNFMQIILTEEERQQRVEWGRQGGKKLLRKYGKAHFRRAAMISNEKQRLAKKRLQSSALKEKALNSKSIVPAKSK